MISLIYTDHYESGQNYLFNFFYYSKLHNQTLGAYTNVSVAKHIIKCYEKSMYLYGLVLESILIYDTFEGLFIKFKFISHI